MGLLGKIGGIITSPFRAIGNAIALPFRLVGNVAQAAFHLLTLQPGKALGDIADMGKAFAKVALPLAQTAGAAIGLGLTPITGGTSMVGGGALAFAARALEEKL